MTGIAQVENAMLARLRAASDANVLGYRYRTLESYPEEFDEYLKTEIKGAAQFPAAWVVFGGWRRPNQAGRSLQTEAVFMLVVAAQNLRTKEKSQRHGGGPGEVGSYQLLQDAAALLHGHRLGLDMGALQLGPCRSVRPTQTIKDLRASVYALEFSTALPIEVDQGDGAIDDFTGFHANWDVPPLAEIEALPADDQADATDHLTLEAP